MGDSMSVRDHLLVIGYHGTLDMQYEAAGIPCLGERYQLDRFFALEMLLFVAEASTKAYLLSLIAQKRLLRD